MVGDCASCGFPILVNDSNAVACPFCDTVNTPISAGLSVSPNTILIGAAVLLGVLIFSKHK